MKTTDATRELIQGELNELIHNLNEAVLDFGDIIWDDEYLPFDRRSRNELNFSIDNVIFCANQVKSYLFQLQTTGDNDDKKTS